MTSALSQTIRRHRRSVAVTGRNDYLADVTCTRDETEPFHGARRIIAAGARWPGCCGAWLGRTCFTVAFPKFVIYEGGGTGEIQVNLTVVRDIERQLLPFLGQMKYTGFDGLANDWTAAVGNGLFFTPVNTVRKAGFAVGAAPTSIARNLGDLKIDYVSDFHVLRGIGLT